MDVEPALNALGSVIILVPIAVLFIAGIQFDDVSDRQ